ncbi:hypothetical protein [Thalassobacillus sp. CUG 92003]|uniref:hypothetical protein n=1 Tax=Thalassobacillus sp. CUG 92003 TaxID=2736641 RepID=UPI0015E64423|nr:hypothetical protein [Thalassobacillus sp. CUG 92003]
MVDRTKVCKACDGFGMLRDDEEWFYMCRICGGSGIMGEEQFSTVLEVDENNRLLD